MRVVPVMTAFLLGIVLVLSARAQDFDWAKRMGGAGDDRGEALAVDASGNVYVTGRFTGAGDFGPFVLSAAGNQDIFVEKLNSSGAVQWAKRMGGSSYDSGYGIAVDGSGNVYVTGFFQGFASFGSFSLSSQYNPALGDRYDIFVVKMDTSGTVLWAKRMGSGDFDYGEGIAVDGSGNVYVTGSFCGFGDELSGTFGSYTLTSEGGYGDIFVTKLNSGGTVLWAQRMGGPNEDLGYAVSVDQTGNAYVTGYFTGAADFGSDTFTVAGRDSFVTKLDSSGSFQWARRMGGGTVAGRGTATGKGVAVFGTSSVYVAGYFTGTADFGAYALTTGGTATFDIFVEKLNNNGTVQWARRMGGDFQVNLGSGIATDTSGNAYVAGAFSGIGDFGTYTLSSAGSKDVFAAKLSSDGTVQWARRMGGVGDDSFLDSGIGVDRNGYVYVTSDFQNTADFGSYSLTASSRDIFVTRLPGCGSPFVADNSYGHLLFSPLCARDASALTQDVYNSNSGWLVRSAGDRYFLSSQGRQFSVLVVDDAVHVNGIDAGLGPYNYQPGVPPLVINVPIESNLVPLPAQDITSKLSFGNSNVLFELLDTQRAIYGNTAVYLVQDCGIWLSGTGPTTINYVSHDDQVPATLPVEYDVRYGVLSHLRADHNFSRIGCLGRFADTPGTVGLANPPAGDGYYFLAKEWGAPPGGGCFGQNYGDSNLATDPRDALNSLAECP